MNFDRNVASGELNALFDCRGNEIASSDGGTASDGCPLAMVYAVNQQFRNINDPGVGLSHGTIFAELDLPFKGSEGVCNR